MIEGLSHIPTEPIQTPIPASAATLRDYFAAAALAGILAMPESASDAANAPVGATVASWSAPWAYEIADAMLEARKR